MATYNIPAHTLQAGATFDVMIVQLETDRAEKVRRLGTGWQAEIRQRVAVGAIDASIKLLRDLKETVNAAELEAVAGEQVEMFGGGS